MSDSERAVADRSPRLSWRVTVLAALLLVAVPVVAVLLFRSSDSDVEPGEPRIVSADELSSFATDIDRRIYWAGKRPGTRLELTDEGGGETYVRYLTGGASAGDERAIFTTVATYPRRNAYAAAVAEARQRSAELNRTRSGGLAITYREKPESVYLVYRGLDDLIEVYDREARKARDLALSGRIRPVPLKPRQ